VSRHPGPLHCHHHRRRGRAGMEPCSRIVLAFHYIVCNPTTKEWETVPSCGLLTRQTSSAYLAFDPAVASHFNLVLFEVEDEKLFLLSVHAYSSETGTWSLNQADEQGGAAARMASPRQVQFCDATFRPSPFCQWLPAFVSMGAGSDEDSCR
jgi:hypothetical protein